MECITLVKQSVETQDFEECGETSGSETAGVAVHYFSGVILTLNCLLC